MSSPMTFPKKSASSLAALSGVLYVLAQPPVSLWFVGYFALIPLFFSLKKGAPHHNFLVGFLSGGVAYMGLVYWVVVAMNTYGGISPPLALLALLLLAAYLALYTGSFALSIAWLEEKMAIPLCLSAPLLWVILEYLKGFLLSGFPWSFMAHSQYNFLPMVQVVSITGTYFLSFLIVAVNSIIYCLISRKGLALWYGALILLLVAGSLTFGLLRLREVPAKDAASERTVAILQGNILQDMKWTDEWRIKTIRTYCSLTLSGGRNVDLVIWPETALPFVYEEEPRVAKVITALPGALSNTLLFGTVSKDDRGRLYNAAFVAGKSGDVVGTYRKTHLVPFGEFTPLSTIFPFIEKLSVAVGNFFPGTSTKPVATDAGKLGVLICYEGIFPSITNESARSGAEVFINITNDAWFGRTSAPYQHLAFYVFRAVETDRYVLRAANTGVSAIIDPRGHIVARTPLFSEEVLRGTYALRQGRTAYVKHGDYFVLLVFLLLAFLVIRRIPSLKYRRG